MAGLTSVLLVLLLGQSRIFFAISRDGLLPPAFSRVHPRSKHRISRPTLTGIGVGLTAGLVPIQEIAELTNIGTLFAFVLVCLGVWILRCIEPEHETAIQDAIGSAGADPGRAFAPDLMCSLPVVTWMRFFVWMAIGLGDLFRLWPLP